MQKTQCPKFEMPSFISCGGLDHGTMKSGTVAMQHQAIIN